MTAPVAGQLGQTLVSRGNLVTADQTPLTTMVSLDPMYVYFDVDEATVERIQQLIREGKLKSSFPQETGSPRFQRASGARSRPCRECGGPRAVRWRSPSKS